jgi:hypothetical protein
MVVILVEKRLINGCFKVGNARGGLPLVVEARHPMQENRQHLRETELGLCRARKPTGTFPF